MISDEDQDIMESIYDEYDEITESIRKVDDWMHELIEVCEANDIRHLLDEVWGYVDVICKAVSDMEYPLIDLKEAFEGEDE